MKRIVVLMLVFSIVFVSAGNVFAATVPGTVYGDQSITGGAGNKKMPAQINMELKALGVKDVTSDFWAAGPIIALIQTGLMKMDENGNFNANEPLSNGDGVAIFARALGIASVNDTPEKAMQKAKEVGLVSSNMQADGDMKRISVAQLIAKAKNITTSPIFNKNDYLFTDFDAVSATDRGIVKALNELGIFIGYNEPGGKFSFRPNNIITRAEIAMLVDRLTR